MEAHIHTAAARTARHKRATEVAPSGRDHQHRDARVVGQTRAHRKVAGQVGLRAARGARRVLLRARRQADAGPCVRRELWKDKLRVFRLQGAAHQGIKASAV